MNIMTVNGRKARIEYDPDTDMFRGEIMGLNGGADFYGRTPDELRREFGKSLNVFLEVCKEKGIEPFRELTSETANPKLESDIEKLIKKLLQEIETLPGKIKEAVKEGMKEIKA
ncbi:type II toxin-antitoxin system HicB family antitoxin [Desulfobacterales bacterium HSG2]|nr:type II toxin-antitoxin system HicB family antitoxin [Desulfobacterales bacterium HSG2]